MAIALGFWYIMIRTVGVSNWFVESIPKQLQPFVGWGIMTVAGPTLIAPIYFGYHWTLLCWVRTSKWNILRSVFQPFLLPGLYLSSSFCILILNGVEFAVFYYLWETFGNGGWDTIPLLVFLICLPWILIPPLFNLFFMFVPLLLTDLSLKDAGDSAVSRGTSFVLFKALRLNHALVVNNFGQVLIWTLISFFVPVIIIFNLLWLAPGSQLLVLPVFNALRNIWRAQIYKTVMASVLRPS